jgi:cytochrome P450
VSVTTEIRNDVAAEADQLAGRLFSPAGAADPYPIYRRLREIAPIHRSGMGHCLLSRHEDIHTVLQHPGAGKDVMALIRGQQVADWERHPSLTRLVHNMIFENPPEHTRLRRLVSKAFTHRALAERLPEIERRVDELLAPLGDGGTVDLLEAFAFPLPIAVIGTLLGVPAADWPQFQDLVRDVTLALEPAVTAEQLARADAAAVGLDDYFRGLERERRARPQDDLFSQMIAAEDNGDRLTERELLSLAQLLFGAGFETTTNLIGNGLVALLDRPDQLQLLRDDPELIPDAVEELLRFDGSVQLTMRRAFTDVPVGDTVIPEGSSMVALLGAGNRDPQRYPDPDRLDVTRTGSRVLSFGGGPHLCLGAALARIEGKFAFAGLLRRFRTIELAGGPLRWKSSLVLRGLHDLPVTLVPA